MNTATRSTTAAIAGNPNCGKTTIFGALTGTRQRIGNWPGVTVERKEGTMKLGSFEKRLVEPFTNRSEETRARVTFDTTDEITLVDLPGIYALSASSEDEIVARDYLLSGEPDLVINIIDAANIERNLYLTTQIMELDIPVLVVLNMLDVAEAKSYQINPKTLSDELGCPVVSAVATKRDGVEAVEQAIKSILSSPASFSQSITFTPEIEKAIQLVNPYVERLPIDAPTRWCAIKALEGDTWIDGLIGDRGDGSAVSTQRKELEIAIGIEIDIALADARYTRIQEIVSVAVKKGATARSSTDRIDRIVMHRYIGIPIFLFVMYGVFWFTITVGGAFIDFFDILFGTIFVDGFGTFLSTIRSPEWLTTLLASGIGSGIQTVSTFIPIIFFMFFSLSLLEDSGYMARAAFVIDRCMRWVGLPGKSFIPMLLGFGCTIPAVMGTRTLDSKRDRYLTIFMTPFMSCGARLPVYALVAAALFPRSAGVVVFSLYLIGILLAVFTGLILKRTVFIGDVSHFVMELPPYHAPRLGRIFQETGHRLTSFLKRAGIVITIVVTLLGFLYSIGYDGDGISFGNEDSSTSLLATIGRSITPVFEPMGISPDNWPATVGLFTGMFAKEAVVISLSSLYGQQNAEKITLESQADFSIWPGVQAAFASVRTGISGVVTGLADPLGTRVISGDELSMAEELDTSETIFGRLRSSFTPAGGYAYMLFVLIYFPCVAALGAAIQEMGIGLGILLAGYLTILAWIVATLTFQIATGVTIIGLVIPVVLGILLGVTLVMIGRRGRSIYA